MERKRVFVTGAGMGVGAGIALEFAKAGYDVAIHHSPSSAESAQELCRKMEGFGAKTLAMEGDLSQAGCMQKMFDRIEKEFGPIHVYVNNAGITVGGSMLEVTDELYDKVLNINLKACYFGIQCAARMMIKYDIEGSILTIASNLMNMSGGYLSLYTMTKMAMKRLVETAAVEYAPFGIRVNGIAPGFVDTGSPRMGEKEPTYRSIPMRRWVSLEEMGQIALFLCGPYTRSIDGHMLFVDGAASLSQAQKGDDFTERCAKIKADIKNELKED